MHLSSSQKAKWFRYNGFYPAEANYGQILAEVQAVMQVWLTRRPACVQKYTKSVRILRIKGMRTPGRRAAPEGGEQQVLSATGRSAGLSTDSYDNTNQVARFRAKGLIQTTCR